MKTAIKLVLFYFAAQIAGLVLAMVCGVIYSYIRYGNVEQASTVALVPSMLLGFVFIVIYLWRAGYISKEKAEWSPISPKYLLFTAVIYFSAVVVIDFILTLMPWLPNYMEDTFETVLSGWVGIICIAVLGPVIEELLFRGAVTKALLRKYSPGKAIVLSALVFGIFHVNPAQVVAATLIGFLLAWLYYKSASLIPCILIHILHNSMTVYLHFNHPGMEIADFFPNTTYYVVVAVSALVFVGMYLVMRKITIPYPWKEEKGESTDV